MKARTGDIRVANRDVEIVVVMLVVQRFRVGWNFHLENADVMITNYQVMTWFARDGDDGLRIRRCRNNEDECGNKGKKHGKPLGPLVRFDSNTLFDLAHFLEGIAAIPNCNSREDERCERSFVPSVVRLI